MPEFKVCSKSEVKKLAEKWGATHLVTMLDPGDHIIRPNCVPAHNHLRLFFDDIDKANATYAPKKEHVKNVLDWSKGLPDDAKCLVHCFAGVSRSTAMAMAMWTQANGFDAEKLTAWISHRPQAWPNTLITKFADELLGLDGKFHEAAIQVGKVHANAKFGILWVPETYEGKDDE